MSAPTRRYHVPSALRRSPLRIDVLEAHRLVAAGALLADVRRHDDESRPLADSIRLPPDEVPLRLAELPRDQAIVLACT